MNILVVGATGNLGMEISRRLVAKQHRVFGLARGVAQSERLRQNDIVAVPGDLAWTASLARACKDKDVVIASATGVNEGTLEAVDRDGMLALVDACKSHVRHFIYVSVADGTPTYPLMEYKRAVEERLRQSGMKFTILRPTFFRDTWITGPLGFNAEARKFTIYGDGTAKVPWVSMKDVARVASACVGNEKASNRTIAISGKQLLSGDEVAELFRKGGVNVSVEKQPQAALAAAREAAMQEKDTLKSTLFSLMLQACQSAPVSWSEAAEVLGNEDFAELSGEVLRFAHLQGENTDFQFCSDDLIIALPLDDNGQPAGYVNLRRETYLAHPIKDPKAYQLQVDANSVLAEPEGGYYLSLSKLAAPKEELTTTASTRPATGVALGVELIVQQKDDQSQDALYKVDPTEGTFFEDDAVTASLDALVRRQVAVAWVPRIATITGCVCILLNLNALDSFKKGGSNG